MRLFPSSNRATDGLRHGTTAGSDWHEWIDDLADWVILSNGALMLWTECFFEDFRFVRLYHALEQTLVEWGLACIPPVNGSEIAIRISPRLLETGIVDDLRIVARLYVGIINVVWSLREQVSDASTTIVDHIPLPRQIQHFALAMCIKHVLIVIDERRIGRICKPLLDGVALAHGLGIEHENASIGSNRKDSSSSVRSWRIPCACHASH